LTELTAPTVAQGRWFNVWVAVQQCATGSEAFEHLFIPGQAEHNSLTAALGEVWEGLDKSAFPSLELVPVAQVTYRAHPTYTTTGRVRMESFQPLLGARSSRIAVANFSPTSHTTLTNRNTDSQHASTAIGPWEWATGTAYRATAGIEHTVTQGGMLFRCVVTHTSGATFAADWALGYWQQIGMLAQNVGANTSAVSDLSAASAFPAVASGQSASFTLDACTAYLFEVCLGPSGESVVCAANFASNIVNCLSDPSNVFSPSETAGKLVVTKNANSAVVVIKNNVGTRNVGFLPVRARVSAVTAWS